MISPATASEAMNSRSSTPSARPITSSDTSCAVMPNRDAGSPGIPAARVGNRAIDTRREKPRRGVDGVKLSLNPGMDMKNAPNRAKIRATP